MDKRILCSLLSGFLHVPLSTNLVAALYATDLIYQFPNGTWVENVARRPEGSIHATSITSPDLHLLQSSSARPDPKLIHTNGGSTSLLEITETTADTIFVVVCNRITDPIPVSPGSSSIRRVSFPQYHSNDDYGPHVSLLTQLPTVGFPNGLVTLGGDRILLADSTKAQVLAIDTETGALDAAIVDPLFSPATEVSNGFDGLKIHGNTLYFANTAQKSLGRVDIKVETGRQLGPAAIVAHNPPPSMPDYFALSRSGDAAFLCNAPSHRIERVDLESRSVAIVNSTEIAQPTAATFGRNEKENILFVTTAGGLLFPVNGDEIVGGQVIAVNLGKEGT
ncbi:uncharacterized protein KY384_006900 [Bacidia gigantensis]|uniref:uncharacterized protein n=1 Tax=Bacidia gigantensis TaxID=2732470 RepID=UPI001D03D284|nr:uncharacterized protein KY384_006900 [Bacidia gigantensis]KAG8527984.1 hypothetical protein KY384_006900 [Bacidia gigantensis]